MDHRVKMEKEYVYIHMCGLPNQICDKQTLFKYFFSKQQGKPGESGPRGLPGQPVSRKSQIFFSSVACL